MKFLYLPKSRNYLHYNKDKKLNQIQIISEIIKENSKKIRIKLLNKKTIVIMISAIY